MGKHDRPKDYSPTKNVKDRRVYPEYVEQATSVSYTRKRNTTPLKPNSYDMVVEYTADKLTIIASNFDLQTGGKIPSNICIKVKAYLDSIKG